jgi:hypothetical protein
MDIDTILIMLHGLRLPTAHGNAETKFLLMDALFGGKSQQRTIKSFLKGALMTLFPD